jgi:hypothetical protein
MLGRRMDCRINPAMTRKARLRKMKKATRRVSSYFIWTKSFHANLYLSEAHLRACEQKPALRNIQISLHKLKCFDILVWFWEMAFNLARVQGRHAVTPHGGARVGSLAYTPGRHDDRSAVYRPLHCRTAGSG